MKNSFLIVLLITQSISLIHIRHLEANKKNREFTLFYNKADEPLIIPPAFNVEPAQLLPDIQDFNNPVDPGPSADLFPEVAEAKPIKKKR